MGEKHLVFQTVNVEVLHFVREGFIRVAIARFQGDEIHPARGNPRQNPRLASLLESPSHVGAGIVMHEGKFSLFGKDSIVGNVNAVWKIH
jgi:hypothetical protein